MHVYYRKLAAGGWWEVASGKSGATRVAPVLVLEFGLELGLCFEST
jgi:hypothetical protein